MQTILKQSNQCATHESNQVGIATYVEHVSIYIYIYRENISRNEITCR